MKKFWMWLGRQATKYGGYALPTDEETIAATSDPEEDMNPSKFFRSYNSFSAADMKIFFEYKDGTAECIAEVQAISWLENMLSGETEGTLITLLFDRDPISSRHREIENILILAADEYGKFARARICDVTFTSHAYGIAIDDIISEQTWNYEAKSLQSWGPFERCYHLYGVTRGEWQSCPDTCSRCKAREEANGKEA